MKNRIALVAIVFMVILTPAFAGGTQDDGAAAPEVAVTPPGTYPIVEESITLNGFGRLDQQHGPWDEMTLWQMLEEKTNIVVDWETPGNDVVQERKNLVLASGDLPDIFIKS